MDSLRGQFPDYGSPADDADYFDDDIGHEAPPSPVGQDERRMQVRAYNFWAGMLDDRNFPSIEDLEPEDLPDFGPYSVLLDFTSGIENPGIPFLGDKLAEECGTDGKIAALDDVPSRSLLSRITDHYMQILANQAPIGFEAEFVNQRGMTTLYRGILLPFSSDDDTIDFIYGVINWKELADQKTTDDLLLEIDEALEAPLAKAMLPRDDSPLSQWADGPIGDVADYDQDETGEDDYRDELVLGEEFEDTSATEDEDEDEDDSVEAVDAGSGKSKAGANTYASLISNLPLAKRISEPQVDWPEPTFAADNDLADGDGGSDTFDLLAEAIVPDLPAFADGDDAIAAEDLSDADAADMALADWLASARELAMVAMGSEDRSRKALYAAIGRAHDFAVAAADAPDDFAELVADSGLTAQLRAPLTPLVKLVFGVDYDKTRLAEYASAIGHAQRLGLGRGTFADYLGKAEGGLKGVVASERRLRRGETAKAAQPRQAPREALARKLRKLDAVPLAEVAAEGSEFTLLVARRMSNGSVMLLGEVGDDTALVERAARKLLD